MTRNVLDGVVELDAKADAAVEEAKATARQLRQQVDTDLASLATQLDAEAQGQRADYARDVEARKEAALGELGRQLEAVLAALATVKSERVGPLAEEVSRVLEQRADGD